MLKPLADRVVVRPMEQEEMTRSGIVLPDTAKEKPQQGKVLAVGPGRVENGQKVPVEVKVDDLVLFPQYGGTKVKVDGEELLVIKESELLAVVE